MLLQNEQAAKYIHDKTGGGGGGGGGGRETSPLGIGKLTISKLKSSYLSSILDLIMS